MKSTKIMFSAACLLMFTAITLFGQAPIKEFVDDKGTEKITKQIKKVMGGYNAHDDGHGLHPYLTSAAQLPDTVALITFYVYDDGMEKSTPAYATKTYITENGGNYFANKLHAEAITKLKEKFKALGVVLLTPDEFLNTEVKRKFYYNEFSPKISKLGKFLSGLETKSTEMAVCADYYRGFDEAAAQDFIRSISLGKELAEKLEVDAVLSIAVQLGYDGRSITLNQVKWTMNGPNPVAKKDKKYPGAFGAGYQEGLVYFASNYSTDAIKIARLKKKELTEENYAGFGDLLSCFVNANMEKMKEMLEKNLK